MEPHADYQRVLELLTKLPGTIGHAAPQMRGNPAKVPSFVTYHPYGKEVSDGMRRISIMFTFGKDGKLTQIHTV